MKSRYAMGACRTEIEVVARVMIVIVVMRDVSQVESRPEPQQKQMIDPAIRCAEMISVFLCKSPLWTSGTEQRRKSVVKVRMC